MADFRLLVRNVLGLESPVDRPPRLAGVVAPERARGGDCDVDAIGVRRVEQDRVKAQPAGARRPVRPGLVSAQSRKLLPRAGAVLRLEQRGVFHAGVDDVGIGQRRLDVPDALEFPRVRRSVVPLVRAGHAVVRELVAGRLPCVAAVIGSVDDLAEPAAALRRVEAVRIRGRPLDVIDLPPAEQRPVDVPALALRVRREDERALARADEYSYCAHSSIVCESTIGDRGGRIGRPRTPDPERTTRAAPSLPARRTSGAA